jgi:hypothetical protein
MIDIDIPNNSTQSHNHLYQTPNMNTMAYAAPGLNLIRIRIGLTSLDATRKLTLTPKNQLPDTPMPWIWHCSPLQFGNIEIALSDTS